MGKLFPLDGGSTREAGDGGEIPALNRLVAQITPILTFPHQGGRDFGAGNHKGCPYSDKIKSDIRSPIIIVVTLVLARMQSGMMEASATRRPSSP